MKFVTPSRKARTAQLAYLFKNTFTIFARSSTIIRPIVKMSIYASLMVCVFAAALVLILYKRADAGWLILLGSLLFVYKFFYYNKVSLVLSRMVYISAIGQDPTEQSARKHLSGLRWQIFVLGLMDMFIVWIRSSRNSDGNFFVNMLLSGIAGLGDMIGHFLLPAFAVDKQGVKESMGSLRALKDNIPESLSGIFGMAIMNRVLLSLLGPLYLLGFLVGIAAGLLLGDYLPAGFSAGEIGQLFPIPESVPLIGPHTIFSWLPLFVMITIGMLLNAILGRVVNALKTVYYTLFYVRVNHADKLAPEIRAELENYLKLDDGTDGETATPFAAAAW